MPVIVLLPLLSVPLLFMAFPGVPLAGRAVVNGASKLSPPWRAFIPDARPRLAATVPVAPPLSRRGLRSWHPGKKTPGCEAQRRFAHALSVVAAGPCSLPAGCHTPV
ncbi:hypothetical protein EBAG_04755 [Escherichia coli T426]|nr:hypothetical protein EBAG_04755 [Escherichia coli T426]